MLKISIVTMSYNDKEHLQTCLAKIAQQDYANIEHIIVDGASKDGSVEVIKAYADEQNARNGNITVKWISEPDKGLYDALNKGIKMSTGDIVGLMNDSFAHAHVLSEMVETMQRDQTDGVHGDINYVNGETVVRRWRMGQGNILWGWQPGHPTMYLKRQVYEKYGLYKTDYKIAADYEFMIRILKDGNVHLSYMDEVLVHMYHGENSSSTGGLSNYILSLKESHRAQKENHLKHVVLNDILRICRVLGQFVSSKKK